MFAEFIGVERLHSKILEYPTPGEEDFSACLQDALKKHTVTFRKGGTVQFEGDKSRSVYCVLEGWLVMSKALSDGQNQIIDFAMPGDIVDPAGADGRTSVMNIGALTDGGRSRRCRGGSGRR